MLNGLDLFTGIGGISLALKEWVQPIAYCEIDPYCQSVLLSRMQTGDLSKAPIWDDIRTLSSQDLPKVFIVYGGFPCQDISIAGNGKGLAGERSGLFYEIVRLCREIEPRFIFLENVPAITTRGGIEVVRQITSLGYDCRWCVISAASVGAPHSRERFFLLANNNSKSGRKTYQEAITDKKNEKTRLRSSGQVGGDEPSNYWKENKCPSFGMDDGLSFELDRAKGLGNAVVTQQTKEAFKILIGLEC